MSEQALMAGHDHDGPTFGPWLASLDAAVAELLANERRLYGAIVVDSCLAALRRNGSDLHRPPTGRPWSTTLTTKN